MIFKTEAWPSGRNWPDEIVLDVGSSMPTDVYGCDRGGEAEGVRYVRKDIAKSDHGEIKRLRRALREIRAKVERHPAGTLKTWLTHCNCAECIATRALKWRGK